MALNSSEWAELAKVSQSRLVDRRATEWKLAFGLWAAIGLVTYGAGSIKGFDPSLHLSEVAVLYILVGLTFIVGWQVPHHTGFAIDRSWFKLYMDLAASPPSDKSIADRKIAALKQTLEVELCECFTIWNEWNWFGFLSQSFMTVLFLVLSWVAISGIHPVQPIPAAAP